MLKSTSFLTLNNGVWMNLIFSNFPDLTYKERNRDPFLSVARRNGLFCFAKPIFENDHLMEMTV